MTPSRFHVGLLIREHHPAGEGNQPIRKDNPGVHSLRTHNNLREKEDFLEF